MRSLFTPLAALAAVCGASAFGQVVVSDAPATSSSIVVPPLTVVSIEILAPLGSKMSKAGDTFPIRLAAPITIEGRQVVPAGASGLGEVVHAKKSGGMGAAGELVLAARFIEHDHRRLKLRSLHLPSVGKSSINTVNAINVGSAASPIPIGLIGFFINGGQITVAAGTIAEAKTAEAFLLSESVAPTTSESNQGG